MTIHIYYRHTPSVRSSGKFRPSWFSHENCFLNLLATIRSNLANGDTRLTVVFDGTQADLEKDFISTHLARKNSGLPDIAHAVSVHRIEAGTQRKAWRACVRIVKEDAATTIRGDDIVYLVENDYLHRKNWVEEVNALDSDDVEWDYLTLYDHPDKYRNCCRHMDASRYPRLPSKLFATSRRHWRTTPSTCATYMMRRETFLQDYPILRWGIYDFRLFRILTKLKRRTLISPLPALATHCMSELLSPTVDWESVSLER